MFYNYGYDNSEYNECDARGACSIAPKVSSLQEVLIIILRQIAFYSLKLDEFGTDITFQTENTVKGIASIISTTDYTDEQLLNIVGKYYALLLKTKNEYIKQCKEKKKRHIELKTDLKITPQTNLTGIISQGERLFLEKYKKNSPQTKYITEILLFVIKTICINLIELANYDEKYQDASKSVLKGLNILNRSPDRVILVKNKIKELVDVNASLIERISKAQLKYFGPIHKKYVSRSTSSGKAILVSGNNMSNLFSLLEQLKDKQIDVYTHDDLLIAHTFENFARYNNLKGHYGDCSGNCILDFATFPGAILLTQNSYQNVEYLYRGRLFTTEDIQPKGVIKLEEDDYSKLIESAENAKGFAKGRRLPDIAAGYNESELELFADNLSKKFEEDKIEKIVIIGHTYKTYKQDAYFNKFFTMVPDNWQLISFSYDSKKDNCYCINLDNNLVMIYTVLKRIFKDIPITSENIVFFITKCDVSSISNMIYLKTLGAKNICMSNCRPRINPSISAVLRSTYGIKELTTPQDDIKSI